MLFLLVSSVFVLVGGQLTIDELFFFNSKYTSKGNCSDFQYTFKNSFRVKSNNYNQVTFNCQSSSITFRNRGQLEASTICSDEEESSKNFLIRLHSSTLTTIQTNELLLPGIELCSLDDFIRDTYSEYSYYRSTWALLINLEKNTQQQQQHLAVASNGEMTFTLFISSSMTDTVVAENRTELVFPEENYFQFKSSSVNVWRVDQGYVRLSQSLENSASYHLSKSKFTLFRNETFFLYGLQVITPRRLSVTIDDTAVMCTYDYILQCVFPLLPVSIHDAHKPVLKVLYNWRTIFNATLTLVPRVRLNLVPTSHPITDIKTLEVAVDKKLCIDNSTKSQFTFNIHLWTRDSNGTLNYKSIPKDDLAPVECNTTAKIGQEMEKLLETVYIKDIKSLDVDLSHRWIDHEDCRVERTRITFT